MELSERLNEIRKIFVRRKTIELKPTIQPEEVDLLEQKYGFQLPKEYRAFITTLGNGATLQPISNDCDELCPFADSPNLTLAAKPFPLTESMDWTQDDSFGDGSEDDEIEQSNAAFDAITQNGQLVLMHDPCEGGLTWVLIVTGERQGEVWLQDEDGYLTPDRTKPITARKLGDDFDRAAVFAVLEQNAARAAEKPAAIPEYPRHGKTGIQPTKVPQTAPKQDGVQRLVDIEQKMAEGKGRG